MTKWYVSVCNFLLNRLIRFMISFNTNFPLIVIDIADNITVILELDN